MHRPLNTWRSQAVEQVTLWRGNDFTTTELYDALVKGENTDPVNEKAVATFLSAWARGAVPQAPRGLRWAGSPRTYNYERGRGNKAKGVKRRSRRSTAQPASLEVQPADWLEFVGTGRDGSLIYRDQDTQRLYSVVEL